MGLESQLNAEQLAAVTHGDGPQLVLAGAGSGKTRVITYRVAWLVREQRVDPAAIAAVTFTNKAADEMRERVEGLLGTTALASFVGTFHRFALRMLRRRGDRVGLRRDFSVFDANDQISLVRRAMAVEELAEASFPPRAVLARISAAKNRLLNPAAYEAQARDFFGRCVAPVYRRYQGMLVQASAVDFDDMICLAVRLLEEDDELGELWRQRLRYLLVDEFQDTNQAQLRLVRALVGPRGNLTAVGDEDQGIYRWRGAELENILAFERSFPGAVVRLLERNYRSTQIVLEASGQLVSNNRGRRGKRLWTSLERGEPIELYKASDQEDEARWVVNALCQLAGEHRLRDMAVLVRTHTQTRALEEQLLHRGVPYQLVAGTRFYDRAEIKDVVAYLRVVRNPRDGYSLTRILNQPPRGIGPATRELLEARAAQLGVPLWEVLLQDGLGTFPPRAARALGAFRELILDLQRTAETSTMPELLAHLVEAAGFAEFLGAGDEEGRARLENIHELLSAAQELSEARLSDRGVEALTGLLDHISLVSDIDEWNEDRGISLLTLHAAKGLEFPVVAVAGLEKGLLPHFSARDQPEELEEERRLLYVGMTRAQKRLLLTCCRRRRIAGRYQEREESPFLAELPERCVTVTRSSRLFDGPRSRDVHRYFDRAADASGAHAKPSAEPTLRTGSRVRHPTLGCGRVVDLEGDGDDGRLTVVFDRCGKRKLVARYAKLEVL